MLLHFIVFIDSVLRFRLPGEAQLIERLMESFAEAAANEHTTYIYIYISNDYIYYIISMTIISSSIMISIII